MQMPKEQLPEEQIAFIGRINASISHELKNIMATISETSGLINDLIELAQKGRELDLDFIKSNNLEIIDEIQRGFTAIRQMNVFAHSVDIPIQEVLLVEVIDLIINLSQFQSFASQVDFVKPDGPGPKVVTHVFLLQDLLYQSLVSAYRLAGPRGRVRIAMHSDNSEVRIILGNVDFSDDKSFPNAIQKKIAAALGARLLLPSSAGDCHIILPLTH